MFQYEDVLQYQIGTLYQILSYITTTNYIPRSCHLMYDVKI